MYYFYYHSEEGFAGSLTLRNIKILTFLRIDRSTEWAYLDR